MSILLLRVTRQISSWRMAVAANLMIRPIGRVWHPPEPEQTSEDWSCSFEIDEPISVRRTIFGVSSVQALMLALKTMSAYLYGSDFYKRGELGIHGQFGGSLSIPAQRNA